MAITISPSDPVNSLSAIRVSAVPATVSSQEAIPTSGGDADILDIAGQLRSQAHERSAQHNQEMARGAARAVTGSIQRETRSDQEELRNLEFERAQLRRELQQTEASLRLLRGRTTFLKNGGSSLNTARILATGLSINILA